MPVWKFKLQCTVIHLLVSVLVAAGAAWLIFGIWYPFPLWALLAVGPIFGLAVVADVVCGPLVTAVLANPAKSVKERVVDFSLVGALQLAALAWAIHTVYVVRPVAVVFEVDRFVVVSANEVIASELGKSAVPVSRLPMFSRLMLGTRDRRADDDFLQSVEMSLAGLGPAMRPSWWVPFSQVQDKMAQRMQPVAQLTQARPAAAAEIEKAIHTAGLPADQLWFLPFTSSRNKDWVVLMNKQQKMLAYAPVDGFIQDNAR